MNIMKRLASLFRALAEDTRLQILWLLCLSDELCVCDVMHLLGITQSKASRHLRYLLNQGVVSDRRDGVWMYYRLAVEPGSPAEEFFAAIRSMLESSPEASTLATRLAERLRAKSACPSAGTAA
jgi:ArsR family transcriptional regulator